LKGKTEKKREQARLRMKKMRNKSVASDSVTEDNVTLETVPASFVQGLNGKLYEVLPERSRYLELSDGQVYDRLNPPIAPPSGDFIQRMQACNESAYNFKPRNRR